MSADLDRLIPRYKRAKNTWMVAASRLQEIAEFLLPYQSNITIFAYEGRKKTNRLYHSAGIVAADKLSRTMHGTVTPSAFEWHSPVMRDESLNRVKPIRNWLQEVSKRMYSARRQSNFSMVAGQKYASLCSLGTGGVFVDEKPTKVPGTFGGYRYTYMPLGTFSMEANGEGQIDTIYRDLRWPLRSLFERFGNAIGDDLLRQMSDAPGKPDKEIDFVHAIYPRQDRDKRRDNTKHWPIASCYFLEKSGSGQTNPGGGLVLSESGFKEKPFMVTRWDVAQRETWGMGPGHLAYPDVRSLNRVRQLKLEAGGTAVLPPTIKTQKLLLTEVSLAPGSVMIRDDAQPGMPAIEAFDNKAHFDVAKLLEDDMTAAINDIYYILELMLPDKGVMTLGEAQIRVEERQRLLGPTMGRLEGEWLMPLFEREFALGLRGGMFPTPPDELLEAVANNQADIDVEWEGPLARAQRSQELVAIDRLNQHIFSVATARPEVLDDIDWDGQIQRYAEITGYPSDLVKDQEQIAQIRDVRAKQQAAQQQMAMVTEGAKAAGAAAPALKAVHEAASTPVGDQSGGAA